MATDARSLSLIQDVRDLQRKARRHQVNGIAGMPIWKYDSFTLTGAGDVTHTLSWVPYGINVLALNGLGLVEGVDYSCDYTTGVVTLSGALTAGDVLAADYVTTGALMVASTPIDTGVTPVHDNFNRADNSSDPNPRSDGGTWDGTTEGGTSWTWGIVSNRLATITNTGGGWQPGGVSGLGDSPGGFTNSSFIRAELGKAAQDVTVTNYRNNTAVDVFVYLNFDPATRGAYWLFVHGAVGSGFIRLYRAQDNATGFTVLSDIFMSSSLGYTTGGATLRVTHDGAGNLAIYKDGTLLDSPVDSSPLTGTWVGLGGGTYFDDFAAV